MSLETPRTDEINQNIITQLETELNQRIPLLPKSFMRVLAKVLSGVFILLYKYCGFIFLQLFVRTASDNLTMINGVQIRPLTEWGRLIGVGERGAAVQAELRVRVTVENDLGVLPSNTQLSSATNGVTYITIGSVSLSSADVIINVRAVSDQSGGDGSGAIGNLSSGAILSFANPMASVNRNATVIEQSVTGVDAESEDNYRARIIDRFQKRPQGGALADYEIWGEEVTGIINIYPYTSSCPGQIDVYVEATPESAGNAIGRPTAAQLQAVRDSINSDINGLASRRPANALVNTFAISRLFFEVTVSGLQVSDLADVRSLITEAVEEYFLDREPFIEGLSTLPRRDRITQTAVGGVIDDIVSARGGIFASAIVERNNQTVRIYTLGQGQKAVASSVVFA